MNEENEIEIAKFIREHKFKIEINRGMKGNYGWIIGAKNDDKDKCLSDIIELDKKLKELFLK